MDNFNALSKSAILTKLALDGYFIDLLTLNSFIDKWQVEAIYENEFGVEFFDNTSYEIILNKLKEKYNKTKEELEGNLKEKYQTKESSADESLNAENASLDNSAPDSDLSFDNKKSLDDMENSDSVSLDELAKEGENPAKEEAKEEYAANISNTEPKETYDNKEAAQVQSIDDKGNDTVSLDEIQNDARLLAENETEKAQNFEDTEASKPYETIMPEAMKRLTPAPVSPMSSVNVNRSYADCADEADESGYVDEFKEVSAEEYLNADTTDIIENESFSPEEIEKANNLINGATESESETEDKSENISAEADKNVSEEAESGDELDLMQLAQTFAQNLTGGPSSAKDVPPADLDKMFDEPYAEPFEDLQDFVKETQDEEQIEECKVEEYKSLQEGVPSDTVIPEVQEASLVPKDTNASNLTAQDIRSIIRDEISRQSAGVVPRPQNGEDIREIIREIVKQTADVAPQNAFKLDISHGTLDMIAKTIAKKIAVKLNSYYKLNSTKQNAKLQLFRERTLELKEKNQILAEENKKLKLQLMETNEVLNSYKPSLFGLFKYTGKKRK